MTEEGALALCYGITLIFCASMGYGGAALPFLFALAACAFYNIHRKYRDGGR